MNHYLMLLRLRDISRNNLIQKAKVYLAGRQPPAGVKVHLGPRGKPYYMSEDLKALKESKKKDKPKEETGEKKKRLPAFKEGNYDNLIHRTKTGEYGPGTYEIKRFSQGGKHIYSLSFSSSVDPSKSNHIATSNEIYSEKGSKEHKEAIKHLKTLVGELKQKETPKGPEKPKQRSLKDINADLKDFDIVTNKQKYFRRYLERESKKKSLGGYSLAHKTDGTMVLSHPYWGTHQMSFSSDEDLFKQFEGGINQDLTKVLRAGVQDFEKNPLKHDQKAFLAWQKKKYGEKQAEKKEPENPPKLNIPKINASREQKQAYISQLKSELPEISHASMSILSDAVLMPLEGLHGIRREVGKTDYDSLNELYQKTINNVLDDLKSGVEPANLITQYKRSQRQIDYPDVTPLGAREQPKSKISSDGGKMSVPTFGYDRLKLTDSEYTNEELGQMIQAIHADPHYKNKSGGTYILNPTGRKRSENIAWAITNRKMRKRSGNT